MRKVNEEGERRRGARRRSGGRNEGRGEGRSLISILKELSCQ